MIFLKWISPLFLLLGVIMNIHTSYAKLSRANIIRSIATPNC